PLAMDVQPRAPEYGARRHHACHEVGDGRLAPLLATARSGGITGAAVFREGHQSTGGAYLIAAHHIGVDILYVLTGVNADLNLTHFPSN
ncbi:hypothetical protein MN091_22395, partial [Xanthomonas euvesicatoria]|nr:hypothetical protein [Xanthomonas euvesicatoria]